MEFYVSGKLASPQWTTYLKHDCEYAYCKERKDLILSSSLVKKSKISPEKAVVYDSLRKDLEKVLSTLTERQQLVLRLRFGLLDGKSRTLKEVGRELGFSMELARQIEAKALLKLRHQDRTRDLKMYTDCE